jgi:hypothetical protein
VYAFSGVTLGPRAGFFSGWALLGTYLAFTAASTAEAGLFGVAFFQGSGIWDGAEWLVIALVAGALIALLAYGDIRVATRSLLGLEGISVILIVVLIVVIFVKLLAGSAPDDQGFTADIFKVPSGTSLAPWRRRPCSASSPSRASRARPRWARRPTTRPATSRARSAPPCSWPAASTSSASSPRPWASAPTPPASRRSRRPRRRWATCPRTTSAARWPTSSTSAPR